MAAAQFVHVPGYSALILRENFPDLNQPDALIPRSKEWWMGTDAKWNERDRRWTFPSGATITFGYLDSDDAVFQYQGAAFQCIYIDELTQHSERRYRYLFSRLRKPESGPLAAVPLRMRGGTNPGGRGHGWVRARFVDPHTREPGAAFVPARLVDNPSLNAVEYEKSLQHVDPLTRAQLLDGDWNAVEGGRFRREWFDHRYVCRGDYLILKRPGEAGDGLIVRIWECLRFATCDPAASSKRDADYTVVSVWLVTPRNDLVWLDCERFQAEIPDIVPRIEAVYDRWKLAFMGIEAVGANAGVLQLASRTRMATRRLNPLGEDKLIRATTALNYAAEGRIWMPARGARPGFPLDDVEGEILRYTGDQKKDATDDIVDTVAYAAKILSDGGAIAASGAASLPRVFGGRM